MKAWMMLGVLMVAVAGCAAEPAADEAGTMEDAVTASDARKAILDGLRVPVAKDFAGASSLGGFKLVFRVATIESDTSKAFVRAHIMKRDARGVDHELADADYRGSAYEEAIAEGFFDGPEVVAALAKKDGRWSIMQRGSGDDLRIAYAVGPTDVAWTDWDTTFGLPRAWLGLGDAAGQ